MTEAFMPGIKTINGHTYIKIQDLADDWHTSTSHILRTGKPNQVPEKYRCTIDGHTWCDVEGLRYRLSTMKRGGRIPMQLNQFLQRFEKDEKHVDPGLGPSIETKHLENGSTATIKRSFLQRIDHPNTEEIQVALNNRQVLWRWKNSAVQVLAQTLSNYLGTRTSSLLAVNKKQGVPQKYIHRQWKRTWVNLDGLKTRVAQTGHSSALLKGLKQVIELLDKYVDAYTRPLIVEEQQAKPEESASASKPSASANPCDLAVEANKRAVHNTERLNKLMNHVETWESREHQYMSDFNSVCKALNKLETRLDNEPVNLQKARLNQLTVRVHNLEDRVAIMKAGDEKAVQAMKEKHTPLDQLASRLGRLATQADRLDTKTDGLVSRVSVLEDTSKWLSWSLATLVSLRFVGLMLRLLKRK